MEKLAQKAIIENNKLIALFMGYSQGKKGDQRWTNDWFTPEGYRHEILLFHDSWDWLMPVVEKCLQGEGEQAPEISNTLIKNIYDALCGIQIEEVYNAVVEFIQ